MVFKIGDNDYSGRVVVDTFNVNRIDIYTEWDDANGTTHRDVYRQRVEGEFDMLIANLAEYEAFVQDVRQHTANGGYVTCKVSVNNYNQENYQANLFVEYTPVRTMMNNYTKGYQSFTVRVRER